LGRKADRGSEEPAQAVRHSRPSAKNPLRAVILALSCIWQGSPVIAHIPACLSVLELILTGLGCVNSDDFETLSSMHKAIYKSGKLDHARKNKDFGSNAILDVKADLAWPSGAGWFDRPRA
jgi:hypothetical protein